VTGMTQRLSGIGRSYAPGSSGPGSIAILDRGWRNATRRALGRDGHHDQGPPGRRAAA
jgi:hypothetical protein